MYFIENFVFHWLKLQKTPVAPLEWYFRGILVHHMAYISKNLGLRRFLPLHPCSLWLIVIWVDTLHPLLQTHDGPTGPWSSCHSSNMEKPPRELQNDLLNDPICLMSQATDKERKNRRNINWSIDKSLKLVLSFLKKTIQRQRIPVLPQWKLVGWSKETRLLTPNPSKNFLYVGSVIWNAVRDLIKLYEFSQNSGSAKCVLKREILKIQKGGNPIEWQHGTWNTLQYLRY